MAIAGVGGHSLFPLPFALLLCLAHSLHCDVWVFLVRSFAVMLEGKCSPDFCGFFFLLRCVLSFDVFMHIDVFGHRYVTLGLALQGAEAPALVHMARGWIKTLCWPNESCWRKARKLLLKPHRGAHQVVRWARQMVLLTQVLLRH
jgi:hypothetical protein